MREARYAVTVTKGSPKNRDTILGCPSLRFLCSTFEASDNNLCVSCWLMMGSGGYDGPVDWLWGSSTMLA